MRIVIIDLRTGKDKVITTKYDFTTSRGRKMIEKYIKKFLKVGEEKEGGVR